MKTNKYKTMYDRFLDRMEKTSPSLVTGVAVIVIFLIYLAFSIGKTGTEQVFSFTDWLAGVALFFGLFCWGYKAGKEQHEINNEEQRHF